VCDERLLLKIQAFGKPQERKRHQEKEKNAVFTLRLQAAGVLL